MSIDPAIAVAPNGDIHVVWEDTCSGPWSGDWDIFYAKYSAGAWSNATVISDNGAWWNTGNSYEPAIAVDASGTVHVVWKDETSTPFSSPTDTEILYINYTVATGWSNATVISDNGNWWNTGNSEMPQIAVDSTGTIHVVWADETASMWGGDKEIMYVNWTSNSGWSNATIVSDNGNWWNTGDSTYPSIVLYNDTLHLVWVDDTPGEWTGGSEEEIMYATYTSSQGWSNATVISDGYNGVWWRDGSLFEPAIAVDNLGGLHVAWSDRTHAEWLTILPRTETEILYVHYNSTIGWSNITLLSDNGNWWNTESSLSPAIAAFNPEAICVIWTDSTDGWWGEDTEIMGAIFGTFALQTEGGIPGFDLTSCLFALILLGTAILFVRFLKYRTYRKFSPSLFFIYVS
ncbi:MAG TPA: hypothetical protein VMV49_10675 [Candidatus Deferrimicrobium sp.]|nr:hypothetical protein [Candidatus Deferrimicrobium sp.]